MTKPTELPFYPDTVAMYAQEFEHELPGDEPSSFEAKTERGPVTVKHSIRCYEKFPEDEIAVEYLADEPDVRRRVTVYRDIRPHLEHPVPIIAMTRDSRFGQDGQFKGSTERLATLEETATALTMARDLFETGDLKPIPSGAARR